MATEDSRKYSYHNGRMALQLSPDRDIASIFTVVVNPIPTVQGTLISVRHLPATVDKNNARLQSFLSRERDEMNTLFAK